MQGSAAITASAAVGALRRTSSSDSARSDGSITISPRYEDAHSPSAHAFSTCGRGGSRGGGPPAAVGLMGGPLMERELEELKGRFVGVLEAKVG